jgi:hypothetical protein
VARLRQTETESGGHIDYVPVFLLYHQSQIRHDGLHIAVHERGQYPVVPDTIRSSRVKEKQFQMAIRYLSWVLHRDKVRIDMASNRPSEKRLTPRAYKVDGWCAATQTSYEVNGSSVMLHTFVHVVHERSFLCMWRV